MAQAHGHCRRRHHCAVAEACAAAGTVFHLPESVASMSPAQLSALTGKSLGDIEDLVPPPPRKRTTESEDRVFEPAFHAETRRPLLQSSTMQSAVYTSQAWSVHNPRTFTHSLTLFAGLALTLLSLSVRFQAEQSMLESSWTLVGRVDEVPAPGDFLTIDTVGLGPVAVRTPSKVFLCARSSSLRHLMQRVLEQVVRGREAEQLHAFANVCRHRGAKVIGSESGSATKVGFICPYHAWTYDLDGKLK